jgi:hypothetical protein
MWEHLICLENVQQDHAIFKCGHLDCYDIETCAIQARVKNIRTILTNGTKGCATKFYYFCGGSLCQHGCV